MSSSAEKPSRHAAVVPNVHPAGVRLLRGPRGPVPYVAMWSAEALLSAPVLATAQGVRYADELPTDRDALGLLWTRVASRPGAGEPIYNRLHPLRQRRAMRRLLCQVCAQLADENEDGFLWLVPDQRDDWPDWPERALCTHPPLCLRCARISVKACPWLASGQLAVRAHSRVSGASGALFLPGVRSAAEGEAATLTYRDPRIAWLQADQLTRELVRCREVAL